MGSHICKQLLLFLGMALQGYAWADEVKQNVREICRQEVAGTLMNAYNDIAILQGQIKVGEQKIQDFHQRISHLQNEYQRLERAAPTRIPAFEVDEKAVSLRYELATLSAQQKETEQSIKQNKKSLSDRESFRKNFENLIKPVFDYSMANKPQAVGLPRLINYHHGCSSYQLLCPLPREQLPALRKIAQMLTTPQPCERYSTVPQP